MKIRLVGAELVRTDRHEAANSRFSRTRLISPLLFSQYVISPETVCLVYTLPTTVGGVAALHGAQDKDVGVDALRAK